VSGASSEHKADTEHPCRQFTRSGRPVKSKISADFMSSDTTVEDSLQSDLSMNERSLKRCRGRPRKRPMSSCADDVEELDIVEGSVTHDTASVTNSQSHDAVSCTSQQCHQQSADDCASDMTTQHGTVLISIKH